MEIFIKVILAFMLILGTIGCVLSFTILGDNVFKKQHVKQAIITSLLSLSLLITALYFAT